MQKNSEYVELSLNGQWIALARKWAEKNAPCEIDHYLVQVSKHMPTHMIDRKGNRVSQVGLARRALRHFRPVIEENILVSVPKKKITGKGYTQAILQSALQNGYVVRSDFPNVKHFGQFAKSLASRGYLVRDSETRWILNPNTGTESHE